MKIVLGSTSPRRKQLLSSLINAFDILAPDVDETVFPGEKPIDFTKRISQDKASDVISRFSEELDCRLIITADTIVTIDNRILGKPSGIDEARSFLSDLSGRTHRVITSITLSALSHGRTEFDSRTFTEITGVTFKPLSPPEINDYLRSIDYRDKAGAYAFQDNGNRIIDHIDGSATNVIGFPLRTFFYGLSECGIINMVFDN